MGDVLTAEQVRNQTIAAMPAPLGEVHYALSIEVSWLHLKWNDFDALFADPKTVDMLNSAAPMFFHDLQRMMWEDILLHLCRVTDPPQSMGHDNLTVRRLPNSIPDAKLRIEIQSLVDDANQKTKFARDWRNRRLAHQELTHNATATPLASASRLHVEDALAVICRAMNRIEEHYQLTPVSYEHPIPALGGVNAMIATLRRGVDAHRAAREAKLRMYRSR